MADGDQSGGPFQAGAERGGAGVVLLGGGVADFALVVDAELHQVEAPG